MIYYDDNHPNPPPPAAPVWVPPANGVMMAEGWITASYNALNQPVAMWSPAYPSGPLAQYMWLGFDPLGRCVKRWMGSATGAPGSTPATFYYYDGWDLIQEGPNGSTADRTYVHGGRVDEIVASQTGGEWVYHHYDARGHCILLTRAINGTIREQYDYDAFGYPYFYNASGGKLGAPFQFGNRFLFTGREWLKDMRAYDYRNRIYQPELGRFLQPDPKGFEGGDYNLYRYCHNDPVNRTDPMGLQDEKKEDPKLVREVTKTIYGTGSNIPLVIRYTESGNWNNTNIADHYVKGLKEQKGSEGSTKGTGSVDQVGNTWTLNLHVDWFVDDDFRGTDVVTRELDHVRDFRLFSQNFARSLSGNVFLAGFPQKVKEAQKESQKKWDPDRLRGGKALDKPHNLDIYKAQAVALPEHENTANEVRTYIPNSEPPY